MKHRILISLFILSLNSFAQKVSHINEILAQLSIEESKCKTDLMISKTVPDNPEETIVVIPEIVNEGERFFDLNSYILIVDSATGEIKHKYFESSTTNKWNSDAVRLAGISIDTAPYNITKTDRAFGIRVRYVGSSHANPFEQETITMYIKKEDSLKQVLKNYPISQYNGEWDTNCAGKFSEQNKTLIVTENLTNGYYNILVKNSISKATSFIDKNNQCEEEEVLSKENQTLKYENGYYK
ncbi:hypothetical protein [Aquimarina sp. 2201CG5-10]|uniref:hypothetical protein n=1 Tax=Aquimarina callyspongiae TaxID=3098150 RepID=UPI002AB43FFC|nr:hypothetical protein [Aquimarina sp. 2201CG5-10]MDY8135653.1 hypothetical protein [Aquimarina sp. 2201CG5-10]